MIRRDEGNGWGVFYRDRRRAYPLIVRGEGPYLYDVEGRRYLDAVGGAMVVAIGHGVPEIAEAMSAQARQVAFAYSGTFDNVPQRRLAERVLSLAPRGFREVYFVSGGSEATEIALKLVRQYHLAKDRPSRTRVVSRWRGYHGATMAALSISGHSPRRRDYLPYLTEGIQIPAPICSRCPFGKTLPSCDTACARELETTIRQEGPESIAAFIAEPIIGNSAPAVVPPSDYYRIIREVCDRYDVLFISDEVICGFGRTGARFGIDHWQVAPDLIVTGKGITSGYSPLGAVLLSDKVVEALQGSERSSFFLGYTYAGNPVTCAAGLAVQEYVERHKLQERVLDLEGAFLDRLQRLAASPLVGDVRGKGLLGGAELVHPDGRRAFPRSHRVAERFADAALRRGVVVVAGSGGVDGVEGDHFAVAPPYVVTETHLDEMLAGLAGALEDLEASLRVG